MCSVRFDSLLSKSGRVIGTRLAYPSYGRDRCKMKRKRILLIVACVFLLGCGKKELSQEKVSEDNAVEKTEESVKQPEEEFTQGKIEKEAGTILLADSKTGLYIKAKEGILKVIEIQGENSKRMSAEEYLRGNPIEKGTCLK